MIKSSLRAGAIPRAGSLVGFLFGKTEAREVTRRVKATRPARRGESTGMSVFQPRGWPLLKGNAFLEVLRAGRILWAPGQLWAHPPVHLLPQSWMPRPGERQNSPSRLYQYLPSATRQAPFLLRDLSTTTLGLLYKCSSRCHLGRGWGGLLQIISGSPPAF